MAKSLTDLVRQSLATNKSSQSSIPTDLPEYVSSYTDDLYVIGHKGDMPVKIKVRSNDCCNGIEIGGGGDTPTPEGGLKYGQTYESFEKLASTLSLLEDNTIYNVNDKGTIEQYICRIDSSGARTLEQVGGGYNSIIADPGTSKSKCPLQNEIEDGVLNFNLPELVIGDYLFKNHTELKAFISDTVSMVSAKEMFKGTSLTTFRGELSALKTADDMFADGPKLDRDSLIYIVDTIQNVEKIEGEHKIHIGYDSKSISPDEITELKAEFLAKGWTSTFK